MKAQGLGATAIVNEFGIASRAGAAGSATDFRKVIFAPENR